METKETTDVMESVLFTDISSQLVNKAKVSQLLPLIRYVACDWNLNTNVEREFRIVKRIIINSIKNN